MMLRIGDFSQRGRVAVKALGHYEAVGLLTPDHERPVSARRSVKLYPMRERYFSSAGDRRFDLTEIRFPLRPS